MLLVVLSVVLTVLQYRWTGQISRAETVRLRAGLAEGLQAFCLAFDSTLAKSCHDLRPDAEDIEALGFENAHNELFQQWKSSKALPVFKRIAYAVPEHGELTLYMVQQQQVRLIASDWPKEWSALQNSMGERLRGSGPPPFKGTSGLLIQFPVFGSLTRQPGSNEEEKSGIKSEAGPARPPGRREYRGRAGGPAEREWAIFELDLDFLRTQWIPNLLREHIGQSNTGLLGRVQIKTRSAPEQIIYSSGQKAGNGNDKRIIISFNRLGSSIGAHEDERPPYWLLEATQNESQLGVIVAQARWRNLGVALVVNSLFLAAGVALIRYTRRSRSLAESQMRFVANVSHELRTPLTVILGAGHNLMKGVIQDSQKVQEYAVLIVQHTQQLSQMVEQVLELGAIKARRFEAGKQSVDVAKAVTEAVATTVEETKGCTLDVQLAPGLATVAGDAGALRRAFQNLITNAAKHGGKGGWIGVTGVTDEESEPKMVEIQVTDHGDGIAEEELKEVFKPF